MIILNFYAVSISIFHFSFVTGKDYPRRALYFYPTNIVVNTDSGVRIPGFILWLHF